MTRSFLPLLFLAACGNPTFAPPEHPAHDKREDGALHARRLESPFACGDPTEPDDERGVDCPTARPPDDLLSCDASGCHGSFDFETSTPISQRHLFGSDGPSCYTCHGEKWD